MERLSPSPGRLPTPRPRSPSTSSSSNLEVSGFPGQEHRGGGMWNPAQYERFRDERKRPFFELLSRVDAAAPAQVADLGCGTGDLTLVLAERWPQARVTGVDSSEAMVAEAARRAAPERVRFELADLARWAPSAPVDVLVSNAALHWLPDHPALLTRLVSQLAPGGVLAFQVPANFEAPSHRRIDEVRAHPRFA